MKNKSIDINKTIQENYDIKNNMCPICDKELSIYETLYISNYKGYHWNCFLKISEGK